MNVRELIALLQQQPLEAMVLLDAQDTGYHTVGALEVVKVRINAQPDSGWEGPHVDADFFLPKASKKEVTEAIRIKASITLSEED